MVKVRISLTIDQNFLKQIDQTVKELRHRNRSHAIEYLAGIGLKKEADKHGNE